MIAIQIWAAYKLQHRAFVVVSSLMSCSEVYVELYFNKVVKRLQKMCTEIVEIEQKRARFSNITTPKSSEIELDSKQRVFKELFLPCCVLVPSSCHMTVITVYKIKLGPY